ncbi:hypothetical protein [Microbacterium sp.]|uniref:hypothetical protein n=1 Tax=Microbacterium sp. TaxID=51671 RepID=UPI0039E3D549
MSALEQNLLFAATAVVLLGTLIVWIVPFFRRRRGARPRERAWYEGPGDDEPGGGDADGGAGDPDAGDEPGPAGGSR